MQSITPKELASRTKPQIKGKSDKYSWRLHQHILRSHPCQLEVWISAWNCIDGHNLEAIQLWHTTKTMPRADHLMIGNMDGQYEGQGKWFHGKSLAQICSPLRERNRWAFSPGHHTDQWVQITDWFWKQYINKGRCTFFPSEHLWVQINASSRKCAYCNQHERRSIFTEQIKKRREIWISDQATH